jgi:hypothetical protein
MDTTMITKKMMEAGISPPWSVSEYVDSLWRHNVLRVYFLKGEGKRESAGTDAGGQESEDGGEDGALH